MSPAPRPPRAIPSRKYRRAAELARELLTARFARQASAENDELLADSAAEVLAEVIGDLELLYLFSRAQATLTVHAVELGVASAGPEERLTQAEWAERFEQALRGLYGFVASRGVTV